MMESIVDNVLNLEKQLAAFPARHLREAPVRVIPVAEDASRSMFAPHSDGTASLGGTQT